MEAESTSQTEHPSDVITSAVEQEIKFTWLQEFIFEKKIGAECKVCNTSWYNPPSKTPMCPSCKNTMTSMIWYNRFCLERVAIIVIVMILTATILLLFGKPDNDWVIGALITGFFIIGFYKIGEVFMSGGGFYIKISAIDLKSSGVRLWAPKRFYIEGIIVVAITTTLLLLMLFSSK